MSTNRIYNWKRQPDDSRDLKSTRHLSVAKLDLPANFELPAKIPVYDQMALGSCTSQSGCACYRFESFQVLNNFDFEPSRLFLYWYTRFIEGTTNEDSGAYIRDAFKAMNKYGLCEEKYFPYDISKFKNKPSADANASGLKNVVVKYTAVDQDLTTMKQTLVSGAAISIGFDVFASFEQGNWDSTTGIMPIPKKNEQILGGHAVTITGFDDSKQCFLIQNSWGTDWGLSGKFWMPYAYALDPNHADDFWCIDEIKIADNPPPPDPSVDVLKIAKTLFATGGDLWTVNKSTLLALGKLLSLPVDPSLSFKKNYNIVAPVLGLAPRKLFWSFLES